MSTVPRLNLHCHLEGCIRPSTAADLARAAGVPDPPDGWEAALVMRTPADLTVYLAHVAAAYPVLNSTAALARVAREAVEDAAADGCDYLEVRCGPATYARNGVPVPEGLTAICEGLAEGAQATGTPAGLIACILRHDDKETNLGVAKAAAALAGRGVVGFDVAGDELLYPALDPFHRPFALAAAAGLGLTAHVAEAGPARNVRQAVAELGVRRIGHGSAVAGDDELLEWSAAEGITYEVCVTSNVLTGVCADAAAHPVRRFVDSGCAVVLGDDDPVTTGSPLGRELRVLHDALGFDAELLERIARRSVDVAFVSDSVRQRLQSRLA
ncbi:MAG: adenosine deaminase [Chloroflexi bacterium]|nr:adenosine deaminase [Chloroflexota bacterium]